jgi:hypothetical protein
MCACSTRDNADLRAGAAASGRRDYSSGLRHARSARGAGEELSELLIRTELPGPQGLFGKRESEGQFYDRIRQEAKRQPGASPALFPAEAVVSRQKYIHPSYPRVDPIQNTPYGEMVQYVEPSYVCHRRLLFEQPNFERYGYDLGFAQTGVQLAVFSYDLVMLPYHFSSDLRIRYECSNGKCLPGDPAPMTLPIERFSVTGVIGQATAIIAGAYAFPN